MHKKKKPLRQKMLHYQKQKKNTCISGTELKSPQSTTGTSAAACARALKALIALPFKPPRLARKKKQFKKKSC
jgi:hypothetical protein